MAERMIAMPDRTLDVRALCHCLCNLEWTGEPYRGSREQFHEDMSRYISKFQQHRHVELMQEKGAPPKIAEPLKHRAFAPEEDEMILQSKNINETARILGRKEGTICGRRRLLRRRIK